MGDIVYFRNLLETIPGGNGVTSVVWLDGGAAFEVEALAWWVGPYGVADGAAVYWKWRIVTTNTAPTGTATQFFCADSANDRPSSGDLQLSYAPSDAGNILEPDIAKAEQLLGGRSHGGFQQGHDLDLLHQYRVAMGQPIRIKPGFGLALMTDEQGSGLPGLYTNVILRRRELGEGAGGVGQVATSIDAATTALEALGTSVDAVGDKVALLQLNERSSTIVDRFGNTFQYHEYGP